MKNLILAIAITFSASTIFSQTLCEECEKSIDHSLKLIASYYADGIADDSAPRETSRQLKMNNEYFKIMINLQLMESNNCKPINHTLNYTKYLKDAIECATQKLMGNYDSPECDINSWGK